MDMNKQVEKDGFKIRAFENLPDNKAVADLDDLDRDILEMHVKDVFFSYNDLAEKWKVTGTTIRNRVKRLKTLGVMDVILVMNPYKIGYDTFAIIGVRVNSGVDFDTVSSTLIALPGVTSVMMVTGRYDFFVQYVCRNTEEFQQFINESLRKIPGIAAVESFIGLELYQRKFELGMIGSSEDNQK